MLLAFATAQLGRRAFALALAVALAYVLQALQADVEPPWLEPLLFEIQKYLAHDDDEVWVRVWRFRPWCWAPWPRPGWPHPAPKRRGLRDDPAWGQALRLTVTCLPLLVVPYFGYRYVYGIYPVLLYLVPPAATRAGLAPVCVFARVLVFNAVVLLAWAHGSSSMQEVPFLGDADRADRPLGISVVIPTYNRDAPLQRAVASVVTGAPATGRDHRRYDGSASDPPPLLPANNRSGVPIRGYRFSRNRGPQAARNLGLRRARFSHVAFLDSDDALLPDKLDRVLERLAKGPVDLLFHGVSGMAAVTAGWARLRQRLLRPVLPFHWLLALLNPVPTPSPAVRRRRAPGPTGPAPQRRLGLPAALRVAGLSAVYLDAPLAAASRPAGTPGGLSAAWRMRCGEFSARRVLLRSGGTADRLRFVLGSLAGALRVLADLLRGRYRR